MPGQKENWGVGMSVDYFPANIDLSSLDGTDGFKLSGSALSVVASAGDVNDDGFDDLIIGAADLGAGVSFVVFGKATGFGANFALSTLDGSDGFRLRGEQVLDQAGFSVASAGDVNNDGFAD